MFLNSFRAQMNSLYIYFTTKYTIFNQFLEKTRIELSKK